VTSRLRAARGDARSHGAAGDPAARLVFQPVRRRRKCQRQACEGANGNIAIFAGDAPKRRLTGARDALRCRTVNRCRAE
jgi:hypothetical protein